jgi:hypothetical protein
LSPRSGQRATATKDWCDARAPDGAAAHDQALRSWQSAFRADEIARAYAEHVGGPDAPQTASRDEVFPKFDAEYKNPGAVCDDLEGYLFGSFDLREIAAAEYALVFPAGETDPAKAAPDPGPPQGPDTAAGGGWGRVDPQWAADLLGPLGAALPLTPGGALQHGLYRCHQTRIFGSRTRLDLNYDLALYDDGSLRVAAFTKDASGAIKAGKEFLGTYVYDPKLGGMTSDDWDYDSYDLRKYQIMEAEYEPVDDSPVLVNAFRFVTDAAGRPFLFGVAQFGDESVTGCTGTGATDVPSPIAAAKLEQAARDAVRFRYRTAPGRGLRMDQIEGYLYSSETNFKIFDGDHLDEDVDLLLKDGWAYETPDYSPHDFDAEASKRSETDRWYRWKREGGALLYSNDGDEWLPLKGILGHPLTAESILGSFKTMTVYGADSADTEPVTNARGWFFGADGRFALTSSRKAALFYNSDKAEGTYRLENYTLDLTFDDGSRLRTFVLGWGDRDRNIVVGQDHVSQE